MLVNKWAYACACGESAINVEFVESIDPRGHSLEIWHKDLILAHVYVRDSGDSRRIAQFLTAEVNNKLEHTFPGLFGECNWVVKWTA